MRTFQVQVNGQSYQVQVEEIQPGAAQPVIAAQPAAMPVEVKAAAPAAPKPQAPADGLQISAPLPGTILSIQVKPGDSVKKGQILMILEAMKMENEILAPQDGQVTGTYVTQGASVNAGDLLVSLS